MSYDSTTPNFGLPQWVDSDEFQMEDFNTAFDRIDEKAMRSADLADFVAEQGSSGNWQYRKWNSGKAEAWFGNTYANLTFGGDVGSGALFQYARYNLTLELPSGLFTGSPRTVLAAASRGTSVYPFGAFVNTRSSTTVDVVLWSAIGGALPNVSVELYAVGRWK